MPTKNKGIIFKNASKLYSSVLEERKVPWIHQYGTAKLGYPDEEAFKDLRVATHVWKQGDKFYKLSQEFYGSTQYWWIIPWFNHKPLESYYKYGDKVFVPLDLNVIITYF